MYFSAEQILRSIKALGDVHPFFGITFLACKREELPIAEETVFALDSITEAFLQKHHRLDPRSDWFFQPYKSVKEWVRPDYAPKGLHAVNTGTFLNAFVHQHGSRLWAWDSEYIRFLTTKLPKKKRVPLFDLAVWIYRGFDWPKNTTCAGVLRQFILEFHLTRNELAALFDETLPDSAIHLTLFVTDVAAWDDLRARLPAPPDSKPDEGGTLAHLVTHGVGPAHTFEFSPATRLSLITGDNGLGKSFLLDVAWWALTGSWAVRAAYPGAARRKDKVQIGFEIAGEQSKPVKSEIKFDWDSQSWPSPQKRPTISGLVVYARVDGSFAVWDPARQLSSANERDERASVFTSSQVWDGETSRIEGLVRDWVRWQRSPASPEFQCFEAVLASLSPPDLGTLRPGKPVRIPNDSRDIPTLVHPFGETPVLYASAGVRRIVALAYLIVWAWHEHLVAANLAQRDPQRRMVILVDELEAHLHPKWQREFLPALLGVGKLLAQTLDIQYFVATHSPLVMASAETIFDDSVDKLFHLDLETSGEITLREMQFVPFGDVSSWLTSPVFELRHARSRAGEDAIERAKTIQKRGHGTFAEIQSTHEQLKKLLAAEDRFWPRWLVFAQRNGVDV